MSFARLVEENAFKLISEIDPPKGVNINPFIDQALTLKGRVDALAVTDSEHAVMRMSPLAPCHFLIEKNIEPILSISARDRNRISLQADLLSAWATGVRSVILKIGIDPDWGDQPMVRSSGDLTLEKMIQCISALNTGKDLGGETLDGGTDFLVGAVLEVSDDANANRKLADQLGRFSDLGIHFAILAPTYDLNIVQTFKEKSESAGMKLFAGLILLKSVAMIRYLNNLSGIPSVPHEFLKKMLDSKLKMEAGMDIAADFYKDLKNNSDGVLLQAMGWGSRLPDFLDKIGR